MPFVKAKWACGKFNLRDNNLCLVHKILLHKLFVGNKYYYYSLYLFQVFGLFTFLKMHTKNKYIF